MKLTLFILTLSTLIPAAPQPFHSPETLPRPVSERAEMPVKAAASTCNEVVSKLESFREQATAAKEKNEGMLSRMQRMGLQGQTGMEIQSLTSQLKQLKTDFNSFINGIPSECLDKPSVLSKINMVKDELGEAESSLSRSEYTAQAIVQNAMYANQMRNQNAGGGGGGGRGSAGGSGGGKGSAPKSDPPKYEMQPPGPLPRLPTPPEYHLDIPITVTAPVEPGNSSIVNSAPAALFSDSLTSDASRFGIRDRLRKNATPSDTK
ncbi:MAG: hypothetical protein HYR96_03360 [Deltaproteobacteria bacterium]|nr:hypothetical protein [Deltaproteobacteria bacterium]MBI3294280.1 hypothetical protein [Deltaproteobacteria bacterium]